MAIDNYIGIELTHIYILQMNASLILMSTLFYFNGNQILALLHGLKLKRFQCHLSLFRLSKRLLSLNFLDMCFLFNLEKEKHIIAF